ncbi:MAG: sulfurtransferase TusA family protein [Chloroflexota bacterium]
MDTTPTATHTSDFSGLRCPHLLLAVIKQVRLLKPNDILQITADDLNAPSSINAWAGQCGHEVLDQYEENGSFVFYLKVNSDR